jgi:hypothetical protein
MYDLVGKTVTIDNVSYQIIKMSEINMNMTKDINSFKMGNIDVPQIDITLIPTSYIAEDTILDKYLRYKGLDINDYENWKRRYLKLEEHG